MLRTLLAILAIGLLGGGLAGKWQMAALRFGEIAVDQTFAFWKFFLGLGAGLAVAGALLGVGLAVLARRGKVLPALGLALLAVAIGFALFVPRNIRDRPHVFLLVTDTTRADHLSLYGYHRKTTRFLEEMSGQSVVFDNAMSQGSHTIVSTPCILASLYPSDHGVVSYSTKLWDGFLLVSEILGTEGYSTFGVVTNPHLSKRNGFGQGFDVYEMIGSGTSSAVFAERVNERALELVDSLYVWRDVYDVIDASGEETERAADSVLAVVAPDSVPSAEPDGAGPDGPIFGFLFYTDPHNPYTAPQEYQRLYDPDWEGTPLFSWNTKSQGEIDGKSLYNLIAQYDATITYWDDQFRALTDSLEVRTMLESSLFIYTSDHGEEFWEHGEIGHGHALFEEVVRVPLVFSFPPPVHRPVLPRTSRVVEDVVSSVDILPTLVEYLRIPVDHEMRGRSAMSLALGREDDSDEERVAFMEQIIKQYGAFDIRALRTRDRKCIVTRNYKSSFRNRWDSGDMFFDLVEDPGEQVNLFEERPDEAARYRSRVSAWIEQADARAAEVEVETFEPDAEHLEQLEALGYID